MIDQTKVLYGVVLALVFCVGALFYMQYQLQKSLSGSAAEGESQVPAPRGEAENTAIPGSAYTQVQGTFVSRNGSTLSLQTADGVEQVSVPGSAAIVAVAGQKDPRAYEQEMTQYRAQLAELLKEPAKNKAAIESLQMPLPGVETSVTLQDFVEGDLVVVIKNQSSVTKVVRIPQLQ